MVGPVRIEWGSATSTGYTDWLAGFLGFNAEPAGPGTAPWSATLEIWVLLSDPVQDPV